MCCEHIERKTTAGGEKERKEKPEWAVERADLYGNHNPEVVRRPWTGCWRSLAVEEKGF